MSSPFRLRVEGGPHLGQTFVVERSGLTIGRQDGNDIVLDDARLSRQHARLDLRDGGLVVTDLGSANGTIVNGQRIAGSRPLQPGDTLQLGESRLVLEAPEAGAPAPPARIVERDAATMVGELPTARPRDARDPRQMAGRPRLILQNGIHAGREYPFERDILTIGRHEGNDIALDDTQASRRHAQLTVHDGQTTIADLGSANGTRVNGQPIAGSQLLRPGDVVQVGTSLLRYEVPASAAPTVAAGAPPPTPAWPPPAPGLPPSPVAPTAPLGPATPARQPTAPPATAPRRGFPWSLLLAGLLALLLLCAVASAAGFFLLRGGAGEALDPTASRAPATGGLPAASSSPTAGGIPTPGSGGGNAAPPPPGSTPTLVVTPTPAGAAPTSAPSPTRVAQAAQTATSTAARPAVTPTRPPGGGGSGLSGRRYTNEQWGFELTLPAGWTLEEESDEHVAFLAPSGRGSFLVNFTPPPAGMTPTRRLQLELEATARTDPAFQASTVQINSAITLGGQPAARTTTYRYAQRSGVRVAEADFAVVITGRAVYLFAAIAPQEDFDEHVEDFNAILGSVAFAGP